MGLAVGERHAQVDHRVAGPDTPLHLGAHSLLDGGDEVAGYGAADDLVDELEAPALGQRLDLDVAHGVLTMAPGLLDVPSEPLAGSSERLAERHQERLGLDVDGVPVGESGDQDVGVRLAHAPEHQLVRLRVVLHAQARVLGGQATQRL